MASRVEEARAAIATIEAIASTWDDLYVELVRDAPFAPELAGQVERGRAHFEDLIRELEEAIARG